MKLYDTFSTAIREGAKLRPQARGKLFFNGSSCAVGAGLEVTQGVGECPSAWDALRYYPYLDGFSCCPVTSCQASEYGSGLLYLLTHLNDYHEWTREAIADWLEKEEEKIGYVTVIDIPNTQQPATASAHLAQQVGVERG